MKDHLNLRRIPGRFILGKKATEEYISFDKWKVTFKKWRYCLNIDCMKEHLENCLGTKTM